jgi:hypothetical protein
LALSAEVKVGILALSGVKLKQLRVESFDKFSEFSLDGAHIENIEFGGTIDELGRGKLALNSIGEVTVTEGLLARVAPTRLVCKATTVVVEEGIPALTQFTFDGAGEIPEVDALDLAVVGEGPQSFPESIRVLDLLRANMKTLTSASGIPFLRRLVAPAVLEEVAEGGVGYCPRLEEFVIGDAPLRKIDYASFEGDFWLVNFPLPAALTEVHKEAFVCTGISSLNASECGHLRSFGVSSLASFCDLVLAARFSGVLATVYTKWMRRATFGGIELKAGSDKCCLVFGEVRFTALRPPGGDFTPEMLAGAFINSETAQLFGREASPARPP